MELPPSVVVPYRFPAPSKTKLARGWAPSLLRPGTYAKLFGPFTVRTGTQLEDHSAPISVTAGKVAAAECRPIQIANSIGDQSGIRANPIVGLRLKLCSIFSALAAATLMHVIRAIHERTMRDFTTAPPNVCYYIHNLHSAMVQRIQKVQNTLIHNSHLHNNLRLSQFSMYQLT